MRSKTLNCSLILVYLCFNQIAFAEDDGLGEAVSGFEKSILNISVTRAVPDPESPWAIENLDMTGYSGVVVSGNRVLTLASLVSRAVFIQAQKVDDIEKIPMRVVFADYDANLALLAPIEGSTLGLVKPLAIGEDVSIGNEVLLYSIENERQLQKISMRSMKIDLREATVGGMTLPSYSLTGQTRTTCRADAIIRKSKLVGLCVGVEESQPQILTAGVIQHFLGDNLSKEKYRGFGAFGVSLLPVKSSWQRKQLKVPEGKGAVRIAEVYETSPFGDCLKQDDVLIGVDNIEVDHRGFYRHPKWGSVPIRHYLIAKYVGESINLHFLRDGKAQSCSRKLRRYSNLDNLVPGFAAEGGMPHLIFGGLIFSELNADFLSGFGRDWQRNGPGSFSFIYTYLNRPSLTRRRVIVLANVLGDQINAGYEKLGNLVLKTVNDKTVSSLEDMKIMLRLPGKQRDGLEFSQFIFENGVQVVLPYSGLTEAQKRIEKAYSITDPRSFFVR